MSVPAIGEQDASNATGQIPTSPAAVHVVLDHSSKPINTDDTRPSSSARLSSDNDEHDPPSKASSHSSGTSSFNTDSLLEVLDNDEDGMDEDMILDEEMGSIDAGQPLVSRGGRRSRRRWDPDDEKQDKNPYELVPQLILAHPLAFLPLLSIIPYHFLPAGVILFVPIICVLVVLSTCAHIVIVYLAWYLKVSSFEDVFAAVTGKYGKYGLWTGRIATIISVVGMSTGWIGTIQPLIQPLLNSYAPQNTILSSSLLWTLIASATLLPSLLPSRMTRSLRNAPWVLALLLPVVAFLIIGRTVEVTKAEQTLPIEGDSDIIVPTDSVDQLLSKRSGLSSGSSALAGLTTLAMFFSPHINTLPIHASLERARRGAFPLPCLITSTLLLTLSLPLALVPYYLLSPRDDAVTQGTAAGVFAQLPADDGWVNLARFLMCALILGSSNMWILRGRDVVLKSMGVDRGERQKAGKWVGLALWAVIASLGCLGGWLADKVELLGIMATLAVGWLLPSLFFIVTFHVRSPLSIIFPAHGDQSQVQPTASPAASTTRRTHSRNDSLNDPSTDALLARKERQLQRRRLGRRLWQDLIVYVGILPIGSITVGWTMGHFLGFW